MIFYLSNVIEIPDIFSEKVKSSGVNQPLYDAHSISWTGANNAVLTVEHITALGRQHLRHPVSENGTLNTKEQLWGSFTLLLNQVA